MSNIEDFDVESEEHAAAMKTIDDHVKDSFQKHKKAKFKKLSLDDPEFAEEPPQELSAEDRMQENIEQHNAEPEEEMSLE